MQATHLTTKLPKLLALHEAGRISDAHVRVATDLTYQLDPTVAQWRWVTAQHPTCRFPGCNRRAIRCECDHIDPYNGRNTVISNLEPACLRHHH